MLCLLKGKAGGLTREPARAAGHTPVEHVDRAPAGTSGLGTTVIRGVPAENAGGDGGLSARHG